MRITVTDYTMYKEETCANGGDYSFSTNFIEQGDGTFKVVYSTSSELTYCSICGSFYTGYSCSCGEKEHKKVTLLEVNEAIRAALLGVERGEDWTINIMEY